MINNCYFFYIMDCYDYYFLNLNLVLNGIIIGLLLLFGLVIVIFCVFFIIYYFKYIFLGCIFFDWIGCFGEYDDEQVFVWEEVEVLEMMDDMQRMEYLRVKGMCLVLMYFLFSKVGFEC